MKTYAYYLSEYGKKDKRVDFEARDSIHAGSIIVDRFPTKEVKMFWNVWP